MKDIKIAKERLIGGLFTLVGVNNETIFTSSERGIKPLLQLYESDRDYSQFSFADKAVGKGAAFLYLLLKVKKIHAVLISKPALDLLLQNGVSVFYDNLVENIINRKGDGICPIEQTVLKETDAKKAYLLIKEKLKTLN
ncbi:MAG: DUF1893 domain-containing protein [Clostridia bacterium]|nr:DUF1893 domain-containing protein [Clostridia bacterium]